MTAPTESEIREAIRARSTNWPDDDPWDKVEEAIDTLFDIVRPYGMNDPDPVTGELPSPDATRLWQDLRPSEEQRRLQIRNEAQRRAEDRVRQVIQEEIVAAALQFGAEFPDAPRAKPELVPA